MSDLPSNWAEPVLAAEKRLFTARAACTSGYWKEARDALQLCAESLQAIASATILMESEEIRLKYERGGWVLHRLNDHDAVSKPGICPYCGGKEGEHADICAMWAAA